MSIGGIHGSGQYLWDGGGIARSYGENGRSASAARKRRRSPLAAITIGEPGEIEFSRLRGCATVAEEF
jgi:hypothetical protein